MVETGKLDQHLGGDIPLAGLVIGVADLCAFQIRRNILLQLLFLAALIGATFWWLLRDCDMVFTSKALFKVKYRHNEMLY